MKSILLIGKLPPPYYGPAIATQIILNSTIKNNFKLSFFDTKLNKSVEGLGKFGWKKIFTTLNKYILYSNTVKSEKPEVILIPISQSTIGFIKDAGYIWIGVLKGSKVVIHLRGSQFLNWYNAAFGITKYFIRKTLRSTSGVIVLGNSLRYLFDSFYNPEEIFVVPNGGNFKIPVIEKNKIIITYIANYKASKGFGVFLEAIALLPAEIKNSVEIHALGQWSDLNFKDTCEASIKSNGLNIIFHDPKIADDKFQLLAKTSVFVFTPIAPEGHPWVIVEAMAAGLPVIATDQGAIKESVIDNYNGFIIPAGNSKVLCEKLILLINDAALRKSMGENSKLRYLENFTEDKMVENLSGVINTVLNNHK